MTATTDDPDDAVAPSEAARALGVTVDTLRRWEADGWITATRTPGGHRRFSRAEITRIRTAGRLEP